MQIEILSKTKNPEPSLSEIELSFFNEEQVSFTAKITLAYLAFVIEQNVIAPSLYREALEYLYWCDFDFIEVGRVFDDGEA